MPINYEFIDSLKLKPGEVLTIREEGEHEFWLGSYSSHTESHITMEYRNVPAEIRGGLVTCIG
ncbi:MAG: hypothetical protein J4400_02430 [Candidatus Aenigmarchaeota archaeon]|nr:hypothetical protein [Candidatus Aenigmarchaeota archaeon]